MAAPWTPNTDHDKGLKPQCFFLTGTSPAPPLLPALQSLSGYLIAPTCYHLLKDLVSVPPSLALFIKHVSFLLHSLPLLSS